MLKFPSLNFACCCDIFQVSSKNLKKFGKLLYFGLKIWQTKSKILQVLDATLLILQVSEKLTILSRITK